MTTPLLSNLGAYSLQVGILVLAAFVAERLLKRGSSQLKLRSWQLLLAALLVLPLAQPRHQLPAVPLETVTTATGAGATALLEPSLQRHGTSQIQLLVETLLAAGSVIFLLRVVAGVKGLNRIRQKSRPLERSGETSSLMEDLGVLADLRLSPDLPHPATFGWRKPTVLLPRQFLELGWEARRHVLCHELLHVQRRDWLWLMTEELIRALFWFHPAVRLVLRRIRLRREQVVDRRVVDLCGNRHSYVSTLIRFASSASPGPSLALGTSTHLRFRVRSLISQEDTVSITRLVPALALAVALMTLSAVAAVDSFPLLGVQDIAVAHAATPALGSDDDGEANAKAPQRLKEHGPVTEPLVLKKVLPRYPEDARKSGLQGSVTVETVVDSNGRIQEARVLYSTDSVFEPAVLEALPQWELRPATLDGEAVAVWYNLTTNFSLEDCDKDD